MKKWLDGWEIQLMVSSFVIAEFTLMHRWVGFVGSVIGAGAGFVVTRVVGYFTEKD